MRRLLQILVAFGALVPVFAGLAGVCLGPEMVDKMGVPSLSMDSHYRYLSGLLLGIGIGFWTMIPNIENKTARFQLLTAIVFVGGFARLYSLLTLGMPEPAMVFGLGMELIVAPLLAILQLVVARRAQ
jgi:hypothetical protein